MCFISMRPTLSYIGIFGVFDDRILVASHNKMFSRKKKKDRKHKPGMTEAELNKLEEVAARRGLFNIRKTSKHEGHVKKSDISAPKPFLEGDSASIASSQDSPTMHSKNYPGYSGGDGPGSGQNGKTEADDKTRSVLEKAAMYGDIVPRTKQTQQQVPMPAPTRRLKPSKEQPIRPEQFQQPVPPSRRKSSKKSSKHPRSGEPLPQNYSATKLPPLGSSQEYLASYTGSTESYASTLPAGPPPAPQEGYSIPTPWLPTSTSNNSFFANNEDANGATYDYPSPVKKSPMFQPPTSTKTVVLRKRKSGDFGISLRRSSIIEHSVMGSSAKRTVYFAEPGSTMQSSNEPMPLSHGDRLIAVGDHNVEGASRDDIIGLIKSAKDQLTITVQPINEAAEPVQRSMKLKEHSDEGHRSSNKASKIYWAPPKEHKPEPEPEPEPESVPTTEEILPVDPVYDESQWTEAEKVWFVRDDGFSAAHLLKYNGKPGTSPLPEGKSRIKFELSGETATVDEEKIEKANPEECDSAEDISSLRYLNECGVLNTLQQRYNGGLAHTYAGPHLVSLCSMHHQSGTPSDKVMEMFKGCRRSDMPPHIFSSAQTAYSEMTTTGSDQSVLLTGHSGSGKTQNLHNILRYLITASGSTNGQVTGDKLSAVSTILESFTGARTLNCANASRSVNLYTLNFDRSGQVGSAALQCMLFENSRVVRRPVNEENFSVFYELVEGADPQLSRELFLVEAEQRENLCLFDQDSSEKSELWREEQANGFKKLKNAMETVEFTADEAKAIFNVLAACLHLGIAGSQKVAGTRYQFLKPDAAQKAASLLGFSIENLAHAIFQPSASSLSPASPSTQKRGSISLQRTLSNASATGDDLQCTGQENLEAFIIGLYTEAFRLVISVINRSLSVSNFNTKSSIVVVDTPGMQCPNAVDESGHSTAFASLEDLAYNYVQERLQCLFHHNAFTRLHDRYQQENVSCDFEPLEGDVNAVTDAIDHPPAQARVGGSNLLTDSKGLLWLLDEEALIPGASEESFIERLMMFFGQPVKNGSPVVQKGHKKSHFLMNHMMGSCPVEYDTTNWLKLCRENPITKTVSEILQDSKKKYISTTIGGRTSSGGTFAGSVVGLDNAGRGLTLRRGPSMRKVWNVSTTNINAAAVVKKKSLSMMKKLQVDSLVDALRRTQIHFVFCFTPSQAQGKGQIDVCSLRNQLRGFQLLPATRVHKQGYPEHMVFSEFRRCYEVLCKQLGASKAEHITAPASIGALDKLDDREATEQILKTCDIERSQYRLGISQVLFRTGILAQLESRRNEKLTSVITAIQAQCRGYLARKMYEKRKVQVVAIRCIQRNIKKFIVVRQWPWWRLLTKVLPLVEVHRTEEDLREREAELELLKSKYDKVLSERDDLKKENEKYEAQFNDVVGELSEEQATATHASEMLENETRERMKLEREVKELQAQNHNLRQRCETVEVELAEQRLLHSSERDDLSDSDEDADAAEYKMRYDRMRREAEFKHKKELSDYEEKVEQAEADKKHAEKKLHQMQEELEEQERLVSQHKKKAQRTLAELNDARVHLEETNAKLHELEKKQRKFDSELYAVQAELTEIKSARDRLQREKDQLSVEVYTKKNMLEENSGDIDVLQRKIERLEQELEETTAKDSEDGQQLNNLKKQRRELEAKLKDQEEELDEQAGQIQMLQQAKERLEMNSERTRQQHSKELDNKEEELEEMRVSYQKKIKHLEKQLEEEEEERSASAKHCRELEQQLSELRDNQPYARRDTEAEKRLRKDLKRYKALLDDAQTMIDHLKTDAVNKQQLKQMRAQLEESQYTCANAVKSKKAIELELEDVQAQLEEISKAKQEAESKISFLQREKNELNSRIEEDADDAKELARKYKNLVNQQCEDRKEIVELNSQIDDHKREKEMCNEKILTLQSQLEYLQENTTDKSNVTRLESKARDLEMKLDFEKTSTRRLEVQQGRLKDQVEKLQSERETQAASEHREKEQCKRLQKQLRDAKDEQADILKREQEALQKQHELELEVMEYSNQNESLQADLKLAFKRISDLQIAFEDLEDSDVDAFSGSDDSDSDFDDETVGSWRRNITTRSRGAAGSVSSARLSSKHSITSEEDIPYRPRKYSDSSDKSSKKSDAPEDSVKRKAAVTADSSDESDL